MRPSRLMANRGEYSTRALESRSGAGSTMTSRQDLASLAPHHGSDAPALGIPGDRHLELCSKILQRKRTATLIHSAASGIVPDDSLASHWLHIGFTWIHRQHRGSVDAVLVSPNNCQAPEERQAGANPCSRQTYEVTAV